MPCTKYYSLNIMRQNIMLGKVWSKRRDRDRENAVTKKHSKKKSEKTDTEA